MGILALVLGFPFRMPAKLTSLSRIAVEGMSHITRTYHYHNIILNTQIITEFFRLAYRSISRSTCAYYTLRVSPYFDQSAWHAARRAFRLAMIAAERTKQVPPLKSRQAR